MITSDGSALKHILKRPEVEFRDSGPLKIRVNRAVRDRLNLFGRRRICHKEHASQMAGMAGTSSVEFSALDRVEAFWIFFLFRNAPVLGAVIPKKVFGTLLHCPNLETSNRCVEEFVLELVECF
jgi:hypothetical protein